MKRIILGLGSNKSFNGKSCLELLNDACHDLTTLLKNVIVSSVYRTKAMYVTDQDDFYNMALLGYVTEDYNPFFLLEQIHEIEEKYDGKIVSYLNENLLSGFNNLSKEDSKKVQDYYNN